MGRSNLSNEPVRVSLEAEKSRGTWVWHPRGFRARSRKSVAIAFYKQNRPELFTALPIGQAAGSRRCAGRVKLLLQTADVGIDQLAQFRNLERQLVRADLILLHGGLSGMAGGSAQRARGCLDAFGDRCGNAFVVGSPDPVARQREVDGGEIALQAERLLVELGGKRRRGIDGALDGIEARAGFGGGLLGGGQGLLQFAELVLKLRHGDAFFLRIGSGRGDFDGLGSGEIGHYAIDALRERDGVFAGQDEWRTATASAELSSQ